MSTINHSIKITALLLLSFAVCQSALAVQPPHPHDPPTEDDDPNPGLEIWFVNPDLDVGDDGNTGLSEISPFATIQKAMQEAGPGDLIELAVGDYYQDVITVRSGTDGAPIVIKGPRADGEAGEAVIRGAGNPRIFEINDSFIEMLSFSINGFHHIAGEPELLIGEDSASNYHDKLLYAHGKEELSGLTGLIISDMHFSNAGGECLRFRYFVNNSEIAGSEFHNCGVYDEQFGGDGKNSEAIYIGTSSNDLKDGKNPTADLDASNDNDIYDNIIKFGVVGGVDYGVGGECIDIKEGSEGNFVENNVCIGASDIESGAINIRGDGNYVFNGNHIYGNHGAGVRLGGHKVRGHTYGVNNHIFGNTIEDNLLGGIKFMVSPQGVVCGNSMSFNGDDGLGEVNDNAAGDYGEDYVDENAPTFLPCVPPELPRPPRIPLP